MKNKSITILNLESYLANDKYRKYLHKKRKLVVPTKPEVTNNGKDIYLKYRDVKKQHSICERYGNYHGMTTSSSVLLSLKSGIISQIESNAANLNDAWIVFEGVNNM